MDRKQNDQKIYYEAREFLLSNTPIEITEDVLESYLSLPKPTPENLSLNDIYQRLIESAGNANMKAGVIKGSIGEVKSLGMVLFNFDVQKVLDKYGDDSEHLLDDIIEKLKPKNVIRRTAKSIWPKYCRTMISGAEFLQQFNDSKEFLEWVGYFYYDKKTIAALPMIIDAEIYGIGFPLACDFLKELGFINYGKPDVHIVAIFEAADLVNKGRFVSTKMSPLLINFTV